MIDFSLIWLLREPLQKPSQLSVKLSERRPWRDGLSISSGKMTVEKPLIYHVARGRQLSSVLPAEIHYFVVSHLFAQALETAGCTGWQTYPIVINGMPDTPLAPYYGLAIHGKAGKIDPSLSPKATLLPFRPTGQPVEGRVGLFFHEWDRSDVFMPEGTTLLMLSDKAKRAVEKLEAVTLTRSDQYTQYDI